MVPGRNGDLLTVDPQTVAAVRARRRPPTPTCQPSGAAENPFADHERVKAAIAGVTP